MKILCVGLGRNGTQSFNQFMQGLGFSTTHFYDFKKVKPGSFEENSYGIEEHFNSLPETDVYSDIPTCLIFDKLYERFPEAKYINITRPAKEWILSMQKISGKWAHSHDPYIFEEAYCNFYLNTGKTKIQDLTENELLTIREMHLNKINAFFKDKENYLEVELSDPEIGSKICKFINISSDIEFPSEDIYRSQ